MKQKIFQVVIVFMLIPCITTTAETANPSPQAKNAQNDDSKNLCLQALELAMQIKTPLDQAFGEKGFEGFTEEKTKEESDESGVLSYPPIEEQIKILAKETNDITNKQLKKNIALIFKIKDQLSKQQPPYSATLKEEYLKHIETAFNTFFEKIQSAKKLPVLGVFPAYLKINSGLSQEKNTAVKNLFVLFLLQYINLFNNEDVTITIKNKQYTYPPLKWAFYTAHAGLDKFDQENQLFSFYSKPIVSKIFADISTKVKTLKRKINQASTKNVPKKSTTKEVELDELNLGKQTETFSDITNSLYEQFANIYKILFQPRQNLNKLFVLRPEFKDAFPAIKFNFVESMIESPSLQPEQATILANIALLWIEMINQNIVNTNELIQLKYPTILNNQKPPISQGITAEHWAHLTACAGYNHLCKNSYYDEELKKLNQEKSNPKLNENYQIWYKNIKENIMGWFSSEIDSDL